MRVRDEQSLETTSKVINEEFQKARWCLRPDTNNNDTNNNQILTGDDLSIDRSSIKSFYRNACILVTGGTGFVGKVLLEKLLRTCDSLQCIYVLLRSKRGRSSEERYHELIQNPVNEHLEWKICCCSHRLLFHFNGKLLNEKYTYGSVITGV